MTKETVLIVDDDASNVEFLKDSLLVPSGYAALCATDGEEAVRLALTEEPDLMLLDLQMMLCTFFRLLGLSGEQAMWLMRLKRDVGAVDLTSPIDLPTPASLMTVPDTVPAENEIEECHKLG